MLPLKHLLPFFDLPLVQIEADKYSSLENSIEYFNSNMLDAKPVLIMILCAHCPFVKHLEDELSRLEKDYGDQIQLIAVSSNSLATHPQDGPEYLAKQKAKNGWKFPYLMDLDQSFARSLRAACTPDFFLFSSFDSTGLKELVYRGQFDESRPGNNIVPTGSDLRDALDAVLKSQKVSIKQKPSIGCNIKWKPGFEPPWFV